MSALVIRSFQHLHKLLKVYLLLGLIGAFAVIVHATFLQYPQLAGILMAIASGLYIGKYLMDRVMRARERPPVYAEFILYSLLPRDARNAVLGDLTEAYYRVAFENGMFAATIWYWRQVLSTAVLVIKWQISTGRTLRYSNDMNNNLRDFLPFYRFLQKS